MIITKNSYQITIFREGEHPYTYLDKSWLTEEQISNKLREEFESLGEELKAYKVVIIKLEENQYENEN